MARPSRTARRSTCRIGRKRLCAARERGTRSKGRARHLLRIVCWDRSSRQIERRHRRLAKTKIKRLYLIPILSKALDVLELLERTNGPISLEDVFQQTKISKTSVYRILKTLVHRGYVAQGESGQYRLVSRPRRLRFGFAAQSAEMPFSVAVSSSVSQAAASAGIELLTLDNRYDPDVA